MRSIVIASGNSHKINEIQSIMAGSSVRWIVGSNFDPGKIEESGATYEENAVIKALAYSRISGFPSLADDSGLEVDALNGLPGIRSNRLFGEALSSNEKIHELLKRMADVPESSRTARFVCQAVLVSGGTVIATASGVLEGMILRECRGEAGFGYDPVFVIPDLGKTLAQLSDSEKNTWSHRGKAMRQILDFLLRCPDQSW